jgi:hypothetical protein
MCLIAFLDQKAADIQVERQRRCKLVIYYCFQVRLDGNQKALLALMSLPVPPLPGFEASNAPNTQSGANSNIAVSSASSVTVTSSNKTSEMGAANLPVPVAPTPQMPLNLPLPKFAVATQIWMA